MKRLLTILLVLSIVLVYGQDTKPSGRTSLQAPNNVTWDYNSLDQTIGMSKGTYKWNKFFSAKKVQFLIDSLDIAKQDTITVTTTGTSGPSTLINGTLNIPQYTGGTSSGAVAATTGTAIGTAAKTATIADYTLKTGDFIALTLTNGNSVANATLAVNGGAAKQIRINNVQVNTTVATLAAGAVIILYYDGTYFQMVGSQRTADTDTDNFDRMYWNNTITAGLAIYDYKMLMQGTDGKFYPLTLETGTGTTKTVLTTELRIGSPILYYNSTTDVALNGTTTNVYTEFPLANMTYTANVASWTSQLPIYLKGTVLANGNFKLDNTSATSWITQALPTTDNGFVYILLGQMYSTTAMRLMQYHPMYHYKDGAIRLYIPTHLHSELFGTLTSGYLPYWDGTKLVNTNTIASTTNRLFQTTTQSDIYSASSVINYEVGNQYSLNNSSALFGASTLYGDGTFGAVKFGAVASATYSSDFVVINRNAGTFQENFRVKYDGKVIVPNLVSTNARLLSASPTGQITPITDGFSGQVLKTNGSGVYSFADESGGGIDTTYMTANFVQKWDGTKFVDWINPRPQTLTASLTTVWDVNSGIDANMTMTGDASITLQNLKVSTSGTLHITKQSVNRRLKIKGYTLSISRNIEWDSTGILITGNSKEDSYTWTYNGVVLTINGNKDYNQTSF